jgi:hypothetical protein
VLWKELTKIVEEALRGAATAETAMVGARRAFLGGWPSCARESNQSGSRPVATVAGVSVPVIGRGSGSIERAAEL